MHPVLLAALVGVIAFVAGLFVGGAVVCRSFGELSDVSIPLLASTKLQLALSALRLHRSGQDDKMVEYLEFQIDMELKLFVQRLQEHPRALQEDQFRTLLGRVAEYRMAHPSAERCPDAAPECQMDDGETVQLWPSLNKALTFARRHGMINLARP